MDSLFQENIKPLQADIPTVVVLLFTTILILQFMGNMQLHCCSPNSRKLVVLCNSQCDCLTVALGWGKEHFQWIIPKRIKVKKRFGCSVFKYMSHPPPPPPLLPSLRTT